MTEICIPCTPEMCRASCDLGNKLRKAAKNCGLNEPCRILAPNGKGPECHDVTCPRGREVVLWSKKDNGY